MTKSKPSRSLAIVRGPPKPHLPTPPGYLSEQAKKWWRQVVRDYSMEPHHLKVLESACGAWDRLTQARKLLDAEGLTVVGANGLRVHPATNIERDSRAALLRCVRELDLDSVPIPEVRRPPPLNSNRG